MTGRRGKKFALHLLMHLTLQQGVMPSVCCCFSVTHPCDIPLPYTICVFVYICRADQFDYVMYGKVYKIEGDETSTEAATRL